MFVEREFNRDLFLAFVLTTVGVILRYIHVDFPNTPVIIEIGFTMAYLAAAIIKRNYLVFIVLSFIAFFGPHNDITYLQAYIGNIFSVGPFIIYLRLLYRRWLTNIKSSTITGLLWASAVIIGYQLFTTPLVWVYLGILNKSLNLEFVLQSYTLQPFLFESFIAGAFSALMLIIAEKNKRISDNEIRLKTILSSIGDAVIATDINGNIDFMNPIAEQLTGYTSKDVYKQPLCTVFNIVNSQTRQKCENPVHKVFSEGKVVGLANHTKLIRRDGTEYHIADSAAPILFNKQIAGVVLIFRDVTSEYEKRKQMEEYEHQLEYSLEEKETLLKEIHHRVKNNMHIIMSLLSLQASYIDDDRITGLFEESSNRIRSMAMVHEKLYQNENLNYINVNEYIIDLAKIVIDSYTDDNDVELETNIEELFLEIDLLIPCGLIINELLTNSIKHGMKNQEYKKIIITLTSHNKHITLTIKDNGSGEPDNIYNNKGLGMLLVTNLVQQIHGNFTVKQDNGLQSIITFSY